MTTKTNAAKTATKTLVSARTGWCFRIERADWKIRFYSYETRRHEERVAWFRENSADVYVQYRGSFWSVCTESDGQWNPWLVSEYAEYAEGDVVSNPEVLEGAVADEERGTLETTLTEGQAQELHDLRADQLWSWYELAERYGIDENEARRVYGAVRAGDQIVTVPAMGGEVVRRTSWDMVPSDWADMGTDRDARDLIHAVAGRDGVPCESGRFGDLREVSFCGEVDGLGYRLTFRVAGVGDDGIADVRDVVVRRDPRFDGAAAPEVPYECLDDVHAAAKGESAPTPSEGGFDACGVPTPAEVSAARLALDMADGGALVVNPDRARAVVAAAEGRVRRVPEEDLDGDMAWEFPLGAMEEAVRRVADGTAALRHDLDAMGEGWDPCEYACDSECLRLAEEALTAGLPEGSFLTADCEMDLVDLIWPLFEE